MFGHEQGSFTGADKQRIGRFELADGGTLLLDEISEISPELQAKLLRVLEEREFEQVRAVPIKVDVRIVATTNRNLEHDVTEGNFREDLFYRLNVIPVDLPPLRERGDDIHALMAHYLAHFGAEMGCKPQLTSEGQTLLGHYTWPGNVRELVNVMERLVVLGGDAPLDEHAVRRCLPELKRQSGAIAAEASASHEAALPAASSDMTLADLERQHIIATLERCGDNKQQAAEALGISVRTLWNRLEAISGRASR